MDVIHSSLGTEVPDGPVDLVDYPGNHIITLV
jgi:hypothetical protein